MRHSRNVSLDDDVGGVFLSGGVFLCLAVLIVTVVTIVAVVTVVSLVADVSLVGWWQSIKRAFTWDDHTYLYIGRVGFFLRVQEVIGHRLDFHLVSSPRLSFL